MIKLLWLVTILLIILSLAYIPALSSTIKSSTYFIFYPFLRGGQWISLKIADASRIFSIKYIFSENNQLKKNNERLMAENARLIEIRRENEDLRKLLNADSAKGKKILIVNVIGRHPENTGQYILIDKGRQSGLAKDLILIDENGALIGKLTEVDEYFSKAMLLNDAGSLINAIIQNEKRSQGILKGEHGLILSLDMLSISDIIEAGQSVVTAGGSDIFPKGLLIGSVEKVIFRENDIFQKALINSAVDFNRLERAFVMMPDL